MTRVDIIPVECLSNKHLLSNYKEITRPFNKVLKRIEKYGVDKALTGCTIPEQYTLNTGHETFFFDKLLWLSDRYNDLYLELLSRGFNIDSDNYFKIHVSFREQLKNTQYWNDWKPTPEDMYLNMARLVRRCKYDKVVEELNSEV